eukprot:421201-Prorocentrum_minimum.AAC.1
MASTILIDVLSDRGFSVSHMVIEQPVPERVHPATGLIEIRWEETQAFDIRFARAIIRDQNDMVQHRKR